MRQTARDWTEHYAWDEHLLWWPSAVSVRRSCGLCPCRGDALITALDCIISARVFRDRSLGVHPASAVIVPNHGPSGSASVAETRRPHTQLQAYICTHAGQGGDLDNIRSLSNTSCPSVVALGPCRETRSTKSQKRCGVHGVQAPWQCRDRSPIVGFTVVVVVCGSRAGRVALHLACCCPRHRLDTLR